MTEKSFYLWSPISISYGAGLKKISEIFKDNQIEASVDEVFSIDDVNKALKKVASGGSKGKTIL